MNKNNLKTVEPFYKHRTIGKCLSNGISLVSDNFRSLLRSLLPISLVCAVVFTLICSLIILPKSSLPTFIQSTYGGWLVLLCLVLLVAYSMFVANVYTFVHLYASEYNLSTLKWKIFHRESKERFGKVTVCVAIFFLLLGLVSLIPDIAIVIKICKIILAIVIVVIVSFVVPCMTLIGKGGLAAIKSGMKLTFHNFFSGVGMTAVVLFTIGIVLVLVASPIEFSIFHSFVFNYAEEIGDLPEIPSTYYVFLHILCFVDAVIILLLSVALHTPFAYFYASTQFDYEKKLANIRKH